MSSKQNRDWNGKGVPPVGCTVEVEASQERPSLIMRVLGYSVETPIKARGEQVIYFELEEVNGKSRATRCIESIRPPKQEWDGTGVPPIEMDIEFSDCGADWEKGAVKYIGKDLLVLYRERDQFETYVALCEQEVVFRPVNTERQRIVNKAYEIYRQSDCEIEPFRKLYDLGMLVDQDGNSTVMGEEL